MSIRCSQVKLIRTTGSADLDVEGVDAELLAAGGDVLGSQHGGVGRGLVTVSLDLHTTGDTGDGFATAVDSQFSFLVFYSRETNERSVT